MKQIIIFLITSIYITINSSPGVYYITPQGSCDVIGRPLIHCYTLYQLIREQILFYSGVNSVTLLFLPGTHVMPDNQTLRASQFGEVFIGPWNEEQETAIECHKHTGFITPRAHAQQGLCDRSWHR